ncbi:MAG: hypothetical protein WCB57_08615 [Pseudonocardiaceae bacterium]
MTAHASTIAHLRWGGAVKVRGANFTTRSRLETVVTATTDVAVLVDTAQRLMMAACRPLECG